MRRAILIVLLALPALAGCMSDDGGQVSSKSGTDLVLKFADVGDPFVVFDEGEQRPTDFSPPRDDPARFGRQGGWKARFRRGGSRATRGPLVIESRADLFESAGGAEDDFELYRQAFDELAAGSGGTSLAPPQLGDEAHAITFQQGFPPNAVRYFGIAWRQDNVTASVFLNGFDGRTFLPDAFSLAQKQQRRITKASG